MLKNTMVYLGQRQMTLLLLVIHGTGAGTSTNVAIFFGGNTPGGYGGTYEVGLTEEYNGTNFSEVNDMIIKRRHSAGAGNSGSCFFYWWSTGC